MHPRGLQDGPRTALQAPNKAKIQLHGQDGLQDGQDSPKRAQDCLKLSPRRPNIHPRQEDGAEGGATGKSALAAKITLRTCLRRTPLSLPPLSVSACPCLSVSLSLSLSLSPRSSSPHLLIFLPLPHQREDRKEESGALPGRAPAQCRREEEEVVAREEGGGREGRRERGGRERRPEKESEHSTEPPTPGPGPRYHITSRGGGATAPHTKGVSPCHQPGRGSEGRTSSKMPGAAEALYPPTPACRR